MYKTAAGSFTNHPVNSLTTVPTATSVPSEQSFTVDTHSPGSSIMNPIYLMAPDTCLPAKATRSNPLTINILGVAAIMTSLPAAVMGIGLDVRLICPSRGY